MENVTADKAKKPAEKTAETAGEAARFASEKTSLDCRYGQIGISAVAAAVRYQGAAKNPAYAPAAIKWDVRAEEAA
jgi:hypothetical protein